MLQDPNIHAAIIFGRGRLQNGVIVQPKEPFDPSDEAKLEEFRNKIWYTHTILRTLRCAYNCTITLQANGRAREQLRTLAFAYLQRG